MAKLFFIGFLVFLAAVAYCDAQRSPCPRYESWNRCGRYCEPTCDNNAPSCRKITCTNRTAGCRCNRGFFRDTNRNMCVEAPYCTSRYGK